MTLSPSDINDIIRALQESDWDEAMVTVGEVNIAVSRNGATLPSTAPSLVPAPIAAPLVPAAAPTPTPPTQATVVAPTPPIPPTAPSVDQSNEVTVTATSVGVFWAAPEPGAAPFVSVGSHVGDEDIVCIIEIMKLMNHVPAGVAGTVTGILVSDGQSVERGTPLFTVRPQAA